MAEATVVSIDLAKKSWASNGLVVLRGSRDRIDCELVSLENDSDPPTAEALAERLDRLAGEAGARVLLVDGPQAWKAEHSELEHQRRCEKAVATPGKTAAPGVVKPGSWTGFAELSIELFDRLGERGWARLPRAEAGADEGRFVLESFPTAGWRGLGLKPLPGKGRLRKAELADEVARRLAQLTALHPLRVSGTPSHDELQALVAGLAGVALAGGHRDYYAVVGSPPHRDAGFWREGYIVCPRLPHGVSRVHRLEVRPRPR